MSISPSVGSSRPNGGAEKNESSLYDTPLGSILAKLEVIDSKITALNDLHASSKTLSGQLQRMEANFRLLFHASRSEIAKLKSQLPNDPSCSTINRHGNFAQVDPLRPISDTEIISLLHYPSDITFVQPKILMPHSERVLTSTSSQGSSTNSGSSSDSSSSSSSSSHSSPLSSGSSPHQSPKKNRRSRKKLPQKMPDDQTLPILVDKPVKQKLPKKHRNTESKDASTEPANGTEGHLNRLFCASVRNARDHHAYSVMNAPPSRSHIPDDDMGSHPEAYDKGDQCHQDKMDVEETTVQRNDSPLQREEHTSDIESPNFKYITRSKRRRHGKGYADVTQEGGISEGEIYDDLDDNNMTGDNDRNRESFDRAHRRSITPSSYYRGSRPPRNPRHESSGRRSLYDTPVHGRRVLPSSSSSERRRFSTRSSTDYSRRTPAKRPRRSDDDDSYKSSSTPKRRLPPPSSRNPSPRKTNSRSGGHSSYPRGFQRQRTSSSLTCTTSSSSDRQRRRNRSYKRQH
nr:expressed protein [Hymenolepis microstoma]